jgi:3',5'-cyclic AMP phosphodiesterase CpdA
MGKLNILHISDLHIGNFIYEEVTDLSISIVEAIEDHEKHVDCVVVTGDIFDGKSKDPKKDVNDAIVFFKKLRTELNKKSGNNIRPSDFIFVPGNQDQTRAENGDTLDKYKMFLKGLYLKDYFEKNYNKDYLYTIKVFESKKVAIIGLNSCMIERQALIESETKWLESIDFENDSQRIKIKDAIKGQRKWDDYGMISKSQLREAFDELNDKLNDPNEYSIVTCFHHHFYPFPEIYDKFGDSSLIRNFSNVIDKLQKSNVKVVLHGHKHLPIIRPVTNQKYLSDPNSMLYVFSAGSIGKKGVTNRSFQLVDIYSPDNNRIAEVHRFNYKHEELEAPETFCFPPKRKYEQHDYIMLLEVFSEEFSDEYQKYITEIHEFDNISQKFRIDEIIKNISQTITIFDSVKKDLQKSSKYILMLLLSVHYRINCLYRHRHSASPDVKKILERIESFYQSLVSSNNYERKLFKLLGSNTNSEFAINFDAIEKDASRQERIFTAYCTIAIFFTDLYLTLSEYGEFYYKKEGLNANIKLNENVFHTNIPVTTIKISSDVDRRSSFIQFKCKNPTVHKIAVLIVKDFEKRINKIEDSFKILNLKVYYLSPKIETDNYDLENLNFEAYIPTLLPLLTGDNLYKQKEVFIRELLQNSVDAILLRVKVDKKNGFDKKIKIVFGKKKNPVTGKLRKYLQISDAGIGMDLFKIERYFTSIGRSFYVSDEFEELQKNEQIVYKPISNFGIGFLSAFMVCKEINVRTKSYDTEQGIEIDIPNFDGCFFINKIDKDKDKIETGTVITLYEDERKLLNPKKIIEYINNIIIDFQLDIEVHNKISSKKQLFKSHSIKRDSTLPLFVPLTENGMEKISWTDVIQNKAFIEKYDFGLLIDFSSEPYHHKKEKVFLNSGIILSNSPKEFFEYPFCKQYYNFPSSYLELDVAREKILRFKNDYFKENKALEFLAVQAHDLIGFVKEKKSNLPLSTIDNIYGFFLQNGLCADKLSGLREKLFCLSVTVKSRKTVSITLKPLSDGLLSWVHVDAYAMLQLIHKCLKLFFEEVVKPELSKKKLTSRFGEFLLGFDKEFDSRFHKEFSSKSDKDFFSRFDKEFSHKFEKEFSRKFDKNFSRRFESEFSLEVERDFSRSYEDFSHKFERDFSHSSEKHFYSFDKEFSHKFESVFSEIFKNFEELSHIFDKQLSHKFERVVYHSDKNKHQGFLINLVVSSIFFSRRKRPRVSFFDLYLKLYYFYLTISSSISIDEVEKFELRF